MAKAANLNSHRPSQETPFVFPLRRFTDTSVKNSTTKASESSQLKLSKNSAYFQGSIPKHNPPNRTTTNGSKIAEEISNTTSRGGTKVLDALFLSRKNALVCLPDERFLGSPTVGGSHKMEGSPLQSRLSYQRMSQGQPSVTSTECKPKDILKMKVLELEKRLKNFEKTSRSYKASDLSGDNIGRKNSVKAMTLQKTTTPILTIVPANALYSRTTPKPEEGSIGEFLSKKMSWKPPTTTLSHNDHSAQRGNIYINSIEEDRSQLIETQLSKLKDRITKAMQQDHRTIKALEKVSGSSGPIGSG